MMATSLWELVTTRLLMCNDSCASLDEYLAKTLIILVGDHRQVRINSARFHV